MNRWLTVLGYLSTLSVVLYAVFKFIRIPGASGLMLLSGLLVAVYLPVFQLKKIENRTNLPSRLVDRFGAFLFGMLIISTILQLQHWQIVKFEQDQIIPIIRFSPWVGIYTYLTIGLVYIPWLIIDTARKKKGNTFKNMVGGIGLSLITLSLISSVFSYGPWKQMFGFGNGILVLIYLPWHLWIDRNKGERTYEVFQIIIVVYLLILLIYGIFLDWPVTYQDVIGN